MPGCSWITLYESPLLSDDRDYPLTRCFGRSVIDKTWPIGGSCFYVHDKNCTQFSCTALKLAQALQLSGLRDRLKMIARARSTVMFTTSFTPPLLASAARFQIRYAHPISLDCRQLYIVIVAKPYAWLQERRDPAVS